MLLIPFVQYHKNENKYKLRFLLVLFFFFCLNFNLLLLLKTGPRTESLLFAALYTLKP